MHLLSVGHAHASILFVDKFRGAKTIKSCHFANIAMKRKKVIIRRSRRRKKRGRRKKISSTKPSTEISHIRLMHGWFVSISWSNDQIKMKSAISCDHTWNGCKPLDVMNIADYFCTFWYRPLKCWNWNPCAHFTWIIFCIFNFLLFLFDSFRKPRKLK